MWTNSYPSYNPFAGVLCCPCLLPVIRTRDLTRRELVLSLHISSPPLSSFHQFRISFSSLIPLEVYLRIPNIWISRCFSRTMFSISSLPSLQGKIFLVTGGNTGIGYETCLKLAAKGAKVYMGARSTSKASSAIANIKELHPKADIHILILDHNSLATVVKAANEFVSRESRLNGLILNAGMYAHLPSNLWSTRLPL